MNGTNYEVPHCGAFSPPHSHPSWVTYEFSHYGMEEGRRAFKILTGTPTGKRPLGRSRYRWEDNIRIDLKEIGIFTRNWVNLLQ